MRSAIVYTVGKVGSDSIARGLDLANIPTFHIHTLNKQDIIKMARRSLDAGKFPAAHLCTSMRILQRKPSNPFYITSVRDPVARNLSAFFQNQSSYGIVSSMSTESIFAAFEKKYSHTIPLKWFDREFKQCIGIDIYETPFDRKRLYTMGENWIVFRIDCPDSTKAAVLEQIFDCPVVVKKINVTSDKEGTDQYSGVKRIAKFPPKFIQDIYESKFCHHFWSQKELKALQDKWTLGEGANI